MQHAKFTLRFSNLSEIETACKEDEEQRSGRFIDWISSRISRKCARWVEEIERRESEGEELDRSILEDTPEPWWEELKRCAEGDHVPSRAEGWNHPTSSEHADLLLNHRTLILLTAKSYLPSQRILQIL